MNSVSKNTYIDKLADVLITYNNTNQDIIKMKPADVKASTYFDFGLENYDKDPKFKVGDQARISKYKNIFAESCTPNWSEEVFVIKKIKNTVPGTYVISDLNGGEIVGTFCKK